MANDSKVMGDSDVFSPASGYWIDLPSTIQRASLIGTKVDATLVLFSMMCLITVTLRTPSICRRVTRITLYI